MFNKTLHKINGGIDAVYMTTAGILFIVLIAASFVQVFTRYIMNSSLVGTEELARYCFIWMSLLGGSIAVGRWAHTSISVLYDMLPNVPKKLMFCLHNLLVIALSVIFIMGGIAMMKVSWGQSTPTLHLAKPLIYLAVPLCGFGMIMHAIEHIVDTIEKIRSHDVQNQTIETEVEEI